LRWDQRQRCQWNTDRALRKHGGSEHTSGRVDCLRQAVFDP
jgi:hypothetical protein